MKIKIKPIYLEAWEWDESKSSFEEMGCKMARFDGHVDEPDLMKNLKIRVYGGSQYVNKGDFIIKHGEDSYSVRTKEYFYENYEIL